MPHNKLQTSSRKILLWRVPISTLEASLFSAIAVFLYPPTNVLKILRSLGKERKTQKSSLISKEKVNKEFSLPRNLETMV